jgi:hypothetical protein
LTLIAFDAQLTAIFARHRPLQGLHYVCGAVVVAERLGAVVDRYACVLAEKFVMRRFVSVLKAAPPADVIDENRFIGCGATKHISEQSLQPRSALEDYPALSRVIVHLNNLESVLFSIYSNRVPLIVEGILLVLG